MIATWIGDIRDHKWLAARSIVVGWAALFGLWFVTTRLVFLDDWLFVRGLADVRGFWPDPRRPFFHVLIGAGVTSVTGWIVGRSCRKYRVPMVLLFFISLLVISDLPRFIPAAIDAWGPGHGRFWIIVAVDFIFMRLPIVAAGIWGVRDCLEEFTHQPRLA